MDIFINKTSIHKVFSKVDIIDLIVNRFCEKNGNSRCVTQKLVENQKVSGVFHVEHFSWAVVDLLIVFKTPKTTKKTGC